MIQMKSVSFQYANSAEGVFEINLTIADGECVVLTGPSGGGKTTVTRIINGLAPSYYTGLLTGNIFLDKEPLTQILQYDLVCRIGSVFQDPKSQFFSSELAGEVAFACENYGLPVEEIRKRTDQAITDFSLDELRNQNLDTLSDGEKQRVAIASVYAIRPGIYVCDEPTSNLDKKGAEQLADILRKLKSEGCTLVIAEHRLAWLRGIADRFVYIRDGRIMWERNAVEMEELSDEQRRIAGIREIIGSEAVNIPFSASPVNNSPALCVKELSCQKKDKIIFSNLGFSIYAGQITAITGYNGAGKTSLALVLSGLWKESSGQVIVGGKRLRPAERRKKVWYSSNDTGTQFFTNSVTEELLLNLKHSEECLGKARNLLKKLGLYPYKDAHPASLSGGQKQRLSIACGLLSEREILIFDEPTSGLDGGNMEIIAKVMHDAAKSRKCILIITHDTELINRCCSRVIKMEDIAETESISCSI